MEEKKSKYKGGLAFRVTAEIKGIAEIYVKTKRTDLSKWVLSLVEEHLIEKKVLNAHGELVNGWGDAGTIKVTQRPRNAEWEQSIGIAIAKDSPLYIGLKHYSAGNSQDAPNMSALLRFLVNRELRRAEVLRENGQLTAEWKSRIENIKNRAA